MNYYVNFSNPIFTGWELQKFVNSDLIDKELNRIEQFFIQYKASLFTFEKQKRVRKPSKLATLVKLMVKNHYYKGYYDDKIKELIDSNKFFQANLERITKLVNHIFNRYKYHRKAIEYTTPSIIKCGQKDLGLTKPRIIKDNSNSKYQYWYLLDYIDLEDNNLLTECNKQFVACKKKKYLKLPLAYNQSYHKNLSDYSKSLGKNKFNKSKDKDGVRDSVINYEKINREFEVLFEKEHQISLSKNTNRLTITLPKQSTHNLVESKITDSNCLGIDIGGSFINTLVDSNGEFISFEYLESLVKKIDKVDNLPNKSKIERDYKGKLIAKVLRENEYQINLIIKDYLDYCDNNGIEHLVFEKLDSWNVKWKRDKTLNEKYNRVFKLLRTQGLVELFKKQARKRNIVIHTIPSYYTSQRCSCCHKIDKNNLKSNRKYQCECGCDLDRDVNAARNIKNILERFSNKLCKKNSYNEYESIKFISKEFTKKVLLDEKVKNFSYLLTEC